MQTVLLVDDDKNILESFKRGFRKEPYRVITVDGALEALKLLEGIEVDLVISDEKMPFMNGIELLSRIRKSNPECIRMMLTGETNYETAVKAINQGEIYRFFSKPYSEIELAISIRQALAHKNLIDQSRKLVEVVKMQSTYIETIEKEFPGISHIERSANGTIIIRDSKEDVNTIISDIEKQLINK